MSKALLAPVLVVAGGLIVFSRVVATADDNPNLQDLAKIRGTWEIMSEVYSGSSDGPMSGKGLLVVFSRKKMATINRKKGDVDLEKKGANFFIDATKTPRQMNWWWMVQDIRAEAYALYALEGDSMRVCFVVRHGADRKPHRPRKLESPKGSHVFLWTLKRLRPKEKK